SIKDSNNNTNIRRIATRIVAHRVSGLHRGHLANVPARLPRALPGFLDTDIKCEAAVLIAGPAEKDARCGLVFKFDHVPLGGRCVSRERDVQIGGDTLLDRDPGAWIPSGTTE